MKTVLISTLAVTLAFASTAAMAAPRQTTAELNRAELARIQAMQAPVYTAPAPSIDSPTTVTVTGSMNAAIGNTDSNTVSYLPGATTADTMDSARKPLEAQAQDNPAMPNYPAASADASTGPRPNKQ